jgi:hypothetical protein
MRSDAKNQQTSADTNRLFGVYHKTSGAYFSHFAADGSPVWSDANDARRFTRLEAEAQAACFIAHQHNVQRKAVRL